MRRWIGLLLVTACSFSGRPGSGPVADAPPVDAFVVLDAPVFATCTAACTTGGGTCDPTTGHCVITHPDPGAVACPTGQYCDIKCTGTPMACSGGINCAGAIGCDITCGSGGGTSACSDGDVVCPAVGPCNVNCNGMMACRNHGVKCGGGRCDVRCIGNDACQTGVACNASADCHVQCIGDGACRNGGVSCGLGTCDVTCDGKDACAGGLCTATPATCTFSCCGDNACSGGTSVCPGCTRDDDC